MDVWLASNSERRYALLSKLFPNLHHKGLVGVDETPPNGPVEHQVMAICQRKRMHFRTQIITSSLSQTRC